MLTDTIRKYKRFFSDQGKMYVKRLENADDIPSRIFVDITSLRSFNREDKKHPTPEFEDWVKVNLLYDSNYQQETINDKLTGLIREAVSLVGTMVLDEINPEIDFDSLDTKLLRWIADRAGRSAEMIQGVTDQDVLSTLWNVVAEGKYTIPLLSEALQNAYGFSPARAETVSRTEVITAGRSGQYYADVQSGIVIGKRWMAAHQERTREAHREADGQVVALEDPFIVKGEKMMFPGDTQFGPSADNTINCRCYYERILEGEELK